MFKKISLTILFIALLISTSFSQSYFHHKILMLNLDKEKSEISDSSRLDHVVLGIGRNYSNADFYGNYFLHGKELLVIDQNVISKIDVALNLERSVYYRATLTLDNKTIFYKIENDNMSGYEIKWYNWRKETNEGSLFLENSGFSYPRLSYDGSRIAFVPNYGTISLLIKDNPMCIIDNIVQLESTTRNYILSSNGDRLVLYGQPIGTDQEDIYYLDFSIDDDGITKTEFKKLPASIDNNSNYVLHDIANNGRTVFLRTNNGPAVFYEKDGVWSEPDYIGLDKDKYFSSGTISEDGNVILLQEYVEYYDWGHAHIRYNLFLCFKQTNGLWKTIKVNPDGIYSQGDAHLTKSGTRMFWIPHEDFSSVNDWSYLNK